MPKQNSLAKSYLAEVLVETFQWRKANQGDGEDGSGREGGRGRRNDEFIRNLVDFKLYRKFICSPRRDHNVRWRYHLIWVT